MPTSQLNKLKCGIGNGTEVTLNLSSNLIGNSNDETNFAQNYYWKLQKLQKLLLTDTQVSKIRKAVANGSPANIKWSKTQLSKIVHQENFDLVHHLLYLLDLYQSKKWHH